MPAWPKVGTFPVLLLILYKIGRGRPTARPTEQRRATKPAQGRRTYKGGRRRPTAADGGRRRDRLSNGERRNRPQATELTTERRVQATARSTEWVNDAVGRANDTVDRLLHLPHASPSTPRPHAHVPVRSQKLEISYVCFSVKQLVQI